MSDEIAPYSHRTGETEPPVIEGYYWLDGTLDNNTPFRGIVTVKAHDEHPLLYPVGYDGWFHPDELRGQWWGPIVPPWESSRPGARGYQPITDAIWFTVEGVTFAIHAQDINGLPLPPGVTVCVRPDQE